MFLGGDTIMEHINKKDQFDLFWDWFNRREKHIYENLETETTILAEEISTNLKAVHEDLAFEISFEKKDDKRNFIISADGIKELFDLVIELTNRAPNYKEWIITPFRPRLSQKNQVIEMEGISLDYDDIYFTYEEDDVEDIIHLDIYVNGYDGEDNRFVHTYFILLDSLVGEYDAVTKIGDTVMYPSNPEIEEPLYGFRDLIGIIDALNKTNEVN